MCVTLTLSASLSMTLSMTFENHVTVPTAKEKLPNSLILLMACLYHFNIINIVSVTDVFCQRKMSLILAACHRYRSRKDCMVQGQCVRGVEQVLAGRVLHGVWSEQHAASWFLMVYFENWKHHSTGFCYSFYFPSPMYVRMHMYTCV